MFVWIRQLLIPPALEDEEQSRIAGLLHLLSLTLFVASILSGTTALHFGQYGSALGLFLGAAGQALAFWLTRRGKLRWAARILLLLFLAALSYLLYVGDGSHDTVIAAYPVTIVIAALLLNKREFFAFAFLAMFSVEAIVYGELCGWIVSNHSPYTLPPDMLYFLVVFVITAAGSSLLADNIADSIGRARAARRAAEKSNRELQYEIVERERAEHSVQQQAQQMRQILDTVPQGVLLLNGHRQVVEANPRGRDDLSDLAEAKVGNPLAHLGTLSLEDLLVRHPTVLWHEVQAEERNLQITARPIQIVDSSAGDAPSDDGGWVVVIRDVTHEREIQQRLMQQERLAAIGQLAGGIAHDFNNILTAIQGYAGFALDRLGPDDPSHADLVGIKNGADRAASLTQQLLAFSRKQILQPKVLNLNTIVDNLEDTFRHLLGETIQINKALSPDLRRVRADPGQIEQVIVNLAVNARDAMPHGGHLTLETRNVELDDAYADKHSEVTPGAYVMLAVGDTGTGMSDDVKAHLFEPFFTTKEVGKGTGLGLPTVHGIIAQSGGHVEVDSEWGIGTTFKVYLPRVGVAADESPPTRSLDALPRGTETIVVAEGEDAVRRLICRTLERQGYTVLTAEHPREALLLGIRHPDAIHLLVTDVVLPGMVGNSLADRLLASRPEIKVLCTSDDADEAIAQHSVPVSGIAFLGKPFTPALLASKVREVLDNP